MVLLNEKGIGETYIFANKGFDDKKFHEIYIALVQKFKNEFNGGVSAFKEWYHQNTWIIRGEGDDSYFYHNIRNYKWFDRLDPREVKQYGEKTGLNKQYIKDYLGKYAEEIGELELKKYPNFFIIVHPIRKHGGTVDITPNGNLYLHIATVEKVEIEKIKSFLNDFMLIWYKLYGGAENKIILGKIAASVLTPEIRQYLPKDLGSHKDEFDFLFAQYFANEQNKKDFLKGVEELKNIITSIKDLPYDTSSDYKTSNDFRALNCFQSVPPFKKILKNFNADHVRLFLLKRSLWLYLFCVKEFSVLQTKKLLMKKTNSAGIDTSDLLYSYQHLHIILSENLSPTDLRKNFRENAELLSDFEKSIIAF